MITSRSGADPACDSKREKSFNQATTAFEWEDDEVRDVAGSKETGKGLPTIGDLTAAGPHTTKTKD